MNHRKADERGNYNQYPCRQHQKEAPDLSRERQTEGTYSFLAVVLDTGHGFGHQRTSNPHEVLNKRRCIHVFCMLYTHIQLTDLLKQEIHNSPGLHLHIFSVLHIYM